MPYAHSGKSYRKYQPKKSWHDLSKSKKKRRLVIHRSDAATLSWQRNPFKSTITNTSSTLQRWRWMLLPITVGVWLGLLFYLPYFQITDVTYQGLQAIKYSEIDEAVRSNFLDKKGFLPHNNFFLVNSDAVAKKLQTLYSLNDIRVSKVFPNLLHVEIEEKISTIVYDNGQHYFLLDQNGNTIKQIDTNNQAAATPSSTPAFASPALSLATQQPDQISTSSTLSNVTASSSTPDHIPDLDLIHQTVGDYPVVYMAPLSVLPQSGKLLPPSLVQNVIDTYNALQKSKLGGGIRYFTMDNEAAGLTVNMDAGWKLYIQPENDLATQMNNVSYVLKSNKPTQYIDVRYGDKVYWK